jgi:hypothetical protein
MQGKCEHRKRRKGKEQVGTLVGMWPADKTGAVAGKKESLIGRQLDDLTACSFARLTRRKGENPARPGVKGPAHALDRTTFSAVSATSLQAGVRT